MSGYQERDLRIAIGDLKPAFGVRNPLRSCGTMTRRDEDTRRGIYSGAPAGAHRTRSALGEAGDPPQPSGAAACRESYGFTNR